MNDKQIKLNDLRKGNPNVRIVKATDLYDKADKYDSVINNSFVEDQIMRNPDNLLDGTLNNKVSRLNSLKNKDAVLANQINNVDEIISREEANAGFNTTGIGRRSLDINRARQLGREKVINLANIESLRGNVESELELRKQAQILSAKTRKSRLEAESLSDREVLFRTKLDEDLKAGLISEGQYNKLKKGGFFALEKNKDVYGDGKSNPYTDEVYNTVIKGINDINYARSSYGTIGGNTQRNQELLDEFGGYNPLNNVSDYIKKPKDKITEEDIANENAKLIANLPNHS